MLENMFEAHFKHIYHGITVSAEVKQSIRQMYFIGCDIVSEHLSFLAQEGSIDELAKTIMSFEKELNEFKVEQLKIIEEGIDLNG